MMSRASLLLKEETTSTSLSTLVDKALQRQQKSFPLYEIQLEPSQLVLIQKNCGDRSTVPVNFTKQHQTNDEGFESDIDSLSIVSLDESFTSGHQINVNANGKTPETDSANGSASSDSDTDSPIITTTTSVVTSTDIDDGIKNDETKEYYDLVNCMCYTDVKCVEILVFLIESTVFVFKFHDTKNLQNFYRKFTTLKAVNNQVVYNNNNSNNTINNKKKFNLLHKTDNNGVTHIQIRREPISPKLYVDECGPSSIISINTPEDNLNQLIKKSVEHIKNLNEYNNNFKNKNFENFDNNRSASADNLLDINDDTDLNERITNFNVRKEWNSSENLLNFDQTPKRPERKKKLKSKAPSPPDIEIKQDILSGQYVRVNVNKTETKSKINDEIHPKKLQQQNFNFFKSTSSSHGNTTTSSLNLVKNKAVQILKYAPKKFETSTLSRGSQNKNPRQENWTNSIPRLFKQPRSKSETRSSQSQPQPMAYRYIDTTLNYPLTYVPVATANGRVLKAYEAPTSTLKSYGKSASNGGFNNRSVNINPAHTVSSTFGNRLFGMSSKLKELNTQHDLIDGKWMKNGSERHKNNNNNGDGGGNLKSVIKKDMIENKKKNEKKVTFSAYTTVQVV